MPMLLLLLGVVLCSVAGSAQVLPQADFNTQAAAGKWYLVGFATNTQWFVNHRANMKMGTAQLTPTAEGDLELSYSSLRADGSCWRMDNLARRTDVPGKFFYTSSDSDNSMIIVDAKYDAHILVHVVKTKGDDVSVVNKLYGRSPDISADLVEKFRQFSLETGVEAENIALLPKNGECTAA